MPATVTSTSTDFDLAALHQDAASRLEQLREQQQRLALDAIGDDDISQELANLESEIASTEGELRRLDLAATELERRDAEAQEQAEEARRHAARGRAKKAAARRLPAAEKIDAAAADLAGALAAFASICGQQEASLVEAGEAANPNYPTAVPAVQIDRLVIGSSIRFHMQAAGVENLIPTPWTADRLRPFAESESN